MISAEDINAYLLYLIEKKHISSCQQNQRINAIKFYYEKVLGQERRCYKIHRAKREKTLPDVLSKEEIKSFLAVASVDIRFYCMYSILYSAGLRINELLSLKPDDIDVSRSLIHVRQGKARKTDIRCCRSRLSASYPNIGKGTIRKHGCLNGKRECSFQKVSCRKS